MAAIKRRVMELAAEKPEQSGKKSRKGISKKEAARRRLHGIMTGKIKQSNKSAFKGPVLSDPMAAYKSGYLQ
jgi:hypothetical protein